MPRISDLKTPTPALGPLLSGYAREMIRQWSAYRRAILTNRSALSRHASFVDIEKQIANELWRTARSPNQTSRQLGLGSSQMPPIFDENRDQLEDRSRSERGRLSTGHKGQCEISHCLT
jgi:hypothetical protein